MKHPAPTRVQIFMETYAFGGPAKNLLATLAILKQDYLFQVVTFARGRMPDSAFVCALKQAGVDYVVLRECMRYDPRCISQMGRRIQSFNPHILQVHNAKSRLYLLFLHGMGRRLMTPQIDFYHGETWTDKKQIAYNRLDRFLFKRSTNIVVVSQHQKHMMVEWGIPDKRITCIPNAIKLDSPLPRKLGEIPHLITVGRFSQEKGHLMMLEALDQLMQQCDAPFRVTLVGDGPEMPGLRNYLKQRPELEQRVALPGYQSQPELYYAEADIFVLPSYTEGLPNVLLECAAYENAIVSTKAGGVESLFSHAEEAWLTDIGNIQQLADAMQRLLEDPALRRQLGKAARLKVERDFSMLGRADALDSYYQTVASR